MQQTNCIILSIIFVFLEMIITLIFPLNDVLKIMNIQWDTILQSSPFLKAFVALYVKTKKLHFHYLFKIMVSLKSLLSILFISYTCIWVLVLFLKISCSIFNFFFQFISMSCMFPHNETYTYTYIYIHIYIGRCWASLKTTKQNTINAIFNQVCAIFYDIYKWHLDFMLTISFSSLFYPPGDVYILLFVIYFVNK